MARYRLCGGLAIMPEHDMAMLADMSARGWHLSGFSCGILYLSLIHISVSDLAIYALYIGIFISPIEQLINFCLLYTSRCV